MMVVMHEIVPYKERTMDGRERETLSSSMVTMPFAFPAAVGS
jgi:hypothetical protein